MAIAKTVLVGLALMFVAPPAEGLTDLLTGKVGHVSDVLHRCSDIPNLAVIFAGNPSANTPELISSGRMSNLCKELSARYPDRVIAGWRHAERFGAGDFPSRYQWWKARYRKRSWGCRE